MAYVKICMRTWRSQLGNRETKFKRGIAPREGFIDFNDTKQVVLKPGSMKWKAWDTSISRSKDVSYIADKKKLYEGLCFKNKKEAESFMSKHKQELDKIAANNPLFDHWSVMNIIKRFEPDKTVLYGKDIIED
jgi:hypothetical protein